MKYGTFSKDGGEFIITRFDTPRPWLNCIHNENYGLFFSQTGFGYSFYRNAMQVKLNYIDIFGYVPTHPQTGKFVYLRDVDSGKCWPLAPMHSAKGYRGYRCVHGQGYSRITATRGRIAASFLIFVPVTDEPVELWQVTLRNTDSRARRIKAFPFQEWQLTAPTGVTDTLTFTRASYRADLGAIVARMTNPTSPLMYDAFMTADYPPEDADCKLDAFLGVCGRLDAPAAVEAGACRNSPASGERMCGVLSGTFELPPGGEATFRVLTGVSFGDADVQRYRQRYLSPGRADEDFAAVRDFWADVRARLTVRTPAPAVNLTANSWVKYQNYVTARWCRGTDKGYRDVLQDVMGITPLAPAMCRRWLTESLKFQYANGLCLRGYDHIGDRHDERLHRDSPVWIPLTLSAYLRETGEMDLLAERVPYFDAGHGSVFEHAMAGMRRLYDERGELGLCLIGDGDWNDSLNEVAVEGRGQSVWLTMAAAYAMGVLEEIARAADRTDAADELRDKATELKALVNEHGWDGRWYLYAIADHGEPVGSADNEEGRIHLNAQTWAIFSGVAEGDRLRSVLEVIDNELDSEFGPVLIHPAYTHYVRGIGKVSGKNPGHAENGPIYSHGVAFKMLADLVLGRGEKAFESYMKALPCSPDKSQQRFMGEPFAAARYLIGPACPERFGASPYSYFTAWPAWTFQLIYERMLGVMPWFDCLRIDPCIPGAWDRFEVVRPFRGATYRIRVRNPNHVQRGVRRVTVDGRKSDPSRVPIFADGREHKVTVTMG